MFTIYKGDQMNLLHGDCLDKMKDIPDNAAHLICVDPPYFKVKKDEWDNQWDKPDEFLDWLDLCAGQWARILKPNGSLYCFASPQMSARVEVKISERFNVLNNLVWQKDAACHSAIYGEERFRTFVLMSERIIFAEHYGADNIAKGESGYQAECEKLRGFVFEPIRAYLKEKQENVNEFWYGDKIPKLLLNSGIASNIASAKVIAKHKLDWEYNQFQFITEAQYILLKPLLKFNKEYEELRKEYEELRRYFTVSADVPYTDVWTFKPVSGYKGKHPCEKPQALLEHIISTSTRPGETVMDCFMGSGATGIACQTLEREFIGMEKDDKWFAYAKDRLDNNTAQGRIF